MVWTKRAHTVETLKQPSPDLRLRASYFYPDSFLRSVDAEDMIKAWNEGFETNAKAQLPALKDRIDTLNQVLWKTTKRKAIQGVISANQKFVSVYRICRSGNRRRFSGVSQPGVGC